MSNNILNFPAVFDTKVGTPKIDLSRYIGTPSPATKNFPLSLQLHSLRGLAFSMISDNPSGSQMVVDNRTPAAEIQEKLVGSYPAQLVDVIETIFQGVLVPPNECVTAFTVPEFNTERLCLQVKLAKTEEFDKSFANVVPYFSVTVNVDDEKTYPVDYGDALYPILTGVEDGIGEEFDSIAVCEGSFSPASHEKVIMNAITFMKNNSIAENKVDIETGMLIGGEGSYIELRVPFGFEKMITIYITYNGTM